MSITRQHASPLLIGKERGDVWRLEPLSVSGGAEAVSEAEIQALIFAYPTCLPITEIDPLFEGPVPLCTELNTPAGPIDILMVTPLGLPVLVECKLWRNPQARREVVGQIIDYAKELSRWSSADFQREVSRRLKREGNPVLDLVRATGHQVDEVDFNDALTLNLRRGRFLLLIVGDGIREGVEAIAEYLQSHAGLHFTLGLVELPIYGTPAGDRLVVPRILARTLAISREVVAVPDGFALEETGRSDPDEPVALTDEETSRRDFMLDLVKGLVLDDPEQPLPRVTPKGWLFLYMPAPASSCWIGVLDKRSNRKVGVRLTSNIGTIGEGAIRITVDDWPAIAKQLGGAPDLEEMSPGRYRVEEFLTVDRNAGALERERAINWLRSRVRDFVSVFRPRIRQAVEQLKDM